jgi:Lrp/AsnC family transcriptional regulator for asnA, asnC and gidA
MDEIDIQILQILQKDGRTPFTTIAKLAGVSESTIRSRYANLVAQGVVNTVSIVDPFALNYQAPAIIHVSVEPGKIDEVAGKIKEFPEVSYLLMILGPYDLLIEVFCKDLAHLTEFISERLQNIDHVRGTETQMIARTYKLSHLWSPEFETWENE